MNLKMYVLILTMKMYIKKDEITASLNYCIILKSYQQNHIKHANYYKIVFINRHNKTIL